MRLDLSSGLNLVLAPNEAGKTTLAELVTCLFYGFGQRKGGVHPFDPWQGGEVGGEVVYVLRDKGRHSLRRHLVKRGEKTSLADDAGREINLGGNQPGELHLGMGRGVFLTVSRLGLDDLQGAFSGQVPKDKKEAEEQLKGYFFQEAATRGEVVNPVGVKEDWAGRAQALFSKDRRRGKADQNLLEKIGQAKEALAQARAQEEESRRILAEMEEAGNTAAELKKNRKAVAREVEEARRGLDLAKEMARKLDIESEIRQLSEQGLADEHTEQKARDLSGQISAAEKRAQAAGRQAEQAQAEVKELCPGRDPAQWDKGINELAARFSGLNAREQELSGRRKGLDEQKSAMEGQWGLKVSALAGLDAEAPIALGALQNDLSQAREAADEARRRMNSLEGEAPQPNWVLPLGMVCLGLGLGLLAWNLFLAAGAWALFAGFGPGPGRGRAFYLGPGGPQEDTFPKKRARKTTGPPGAGTRDQGTDRRPFVSNEPAA